ncbi:MAG: hypothetical protein HY266_01715 [Deltaproteobacteria bacterium]|nr:hypothetical protein [Deltaproteobacteria bacterium]
MPTYYTFIKERLDLFDGILQKGFDITTGRLWMMEPAHIRFHLGESIKDLKIPYAFGGEAEDIVEKSILALAALLKRRLEPGAEQNVTASLLDIKATLIEKTYRIDFFLPGSVEKDIACGILTAASVIDSGILKAWLAPDGYGRAYYSLVKGILEKAVLEETRLEGVERTSLLAIMAIVNLCRKKKEEIIGNTKIKGLSYDRLDQAAGLVMYFVFKAAVKNVAAELAQIMNAHGGAAAQDIFETWFTPRSFLTIQGNIISSDLNPYGLQENIASLLRTSYDSAAAKAGDAAGIAALMEEEIRKHSDVEALFHFSRINHLRRLIGDYLLDYDTPQIEVNVRLAEMYVDNRFIQPLFDDSKAAAKLNQGLDGVKEQFQKDAARIEKIDALQDFIASIKRGSLGGWLGIGKKKDAVITEIIGAYIAYRFDEYVEKFVSSMREVMVDRRAEFAPDTLKMEYERGRVYRFSTDEKPVLKEMDIEAEGHLFIDMKDFTKKTLKAKEIAMADFMESNFYKPILSAAGRYGSSAAGLRDNKNSIRLNNLLGDAIIFSGGITNLIALTGDIRRVMKRYKEQLEKRIPHIVEEELLSNIHKNFEAMKEEIGRERAKMEKAIAAGEKGLEASLVELREKEYRLEKTYKEELEAAIGQEMEAGLFITYGSEAEVILMKDNFWGEVKVAIGEKINEAARGTSRSSIVWAKMERLLEEERMKRRNPSLKYPLDIYIGKTYGFVLPPSLDDRLEKMVLHKEAAEAKSLAQLLAQECFNDFGRIISGEPFSSLRILSAASDIYNKGQALSEEALQAYMKEGKGRGFFFKREVQVSELHKEIQDAFFFPLKLLELWFAVFATEGIKYIEVFCKAGEIIFRGFESASPTVVYEIVNKDSEFFKLLVHNHFDTWYEEAQNK